MMVAEEEKANHTSDGQRKRRGGGNVGVFDDSGMTLDDRRKLRRKQRELHHGVTNEIGRGDDEDAMVFLDRKRGDNNELFDKVRFTREAVLDAENTELLATKTLQQVDRLVQVPRFDASKLAGKLRSKCSTGQGTGKQFNWTLIGRECGVCFNALPSGVSFLAGTMDREETFVTRKARRTQKKRFNVDAVEEQRPEQVVNNKGDADQLSAAEKAMKDIKKILKKECKVKEGNPAEVDGVKFLFNPKSFTQTVENIFHFSFLIKRAEAAIGVRDPGTADERNGEHGGLWIKAIKNSDGDEDNQPQSDETTQAVVAFTMRDWRRICESYNLEECVLKHRTGSKHARMKSSSPKTILFEYLDRDSLST